MTSDATSPLGPDGRPVLVAGTLVDVRNRFDRSWVHGFAVAEFDGEAYRIRRLSDGSVLPGVFARDDVRRERRRQDYWWR